MAELELPRQMVFTYYNTCTDASRDFEANIPLTDNFKDDKYLFELKTLLV